MEVARAQDGEMPRVLGVNHHPEIVNRQRQMVVLRKKLQRGAVTEEWAAERLRTLTEPIEDEHGDRLLQLTSSYTFLAPLRAAIYRAAAQRASALGRTLGAPLDALPLAYSLSADAGTRSGSTAP